MRLCISRVRRPGRMPDHRRPMRSDRDSQMPLAINRSRLVMATGEACVEEAGYSHGQD
jgi:hypothetical protein